MGDGIIDLYGVNVIYYGHPTCATTLLVELRSSGSNPTSLSVAIASCSETTDTLAISSGVNSSISASASGRSSLAWNEVRTETIESDNLSDMARVIITEGALYVEPSS